MADDTTTRHQGDRRMHEGRTPGLVPGRGHERHEEPVLLNHPEPGEDQPGLHGGGQDDESSMRDRKQESALGGTVATRSSTRPTPPDERFQQEPKP